MTTNYAMLFPGQGSQRVGMLGELAAQEPVVTETFAEASGILGFDLWELACNGPEEKIKQTEITQPLMLASGVAAGRIWLDKANSKPVMVAGHSVGEIAALVVAGALSFADSVSLVKKRSALMAAAVPEGQGGMAAVIGMDDEEVVKLCAEVLEQMNSEGNTQTADAGAPLVLEAVNFNAPGQVVISGHLTAIEAAIPLASERGARKVMQVPVSVPNHSSLMKNAGESLMTTIDSLDWQTPVIPVVQNRNAAIAPGIDELVATLKLHLQSPVLWVHSIRHMIDEHKVERFVEMGPGKVLTGLAKRIEKSAPSMPVFDPESLGSALESFSAADA